MNIKNIKNQLSLLKNDLKIYSYDYENKNIKLSNFSSIIKKEILD